MKIITVFLLMVLALFSGGFVIEGRVKGLAASGLVSASAGGRSLTVLAVNYRPGRTFYHLAAR